MHLTFEAYQACQHENSLTKIAKFEYESFRRVENMIGEFYEDDVTQNCPQLRKYQKHISLSSGNILNEKNVRQVQDRARLSFISQSSNYDN